MEQPSYQARYQKLSSTSLSAIILMMFSSNSFALPEGGVVGAGEAIITASANKVDIIQNSQKAIIDWRGFDIGTNEQTQFHQPNASSIAINRVNSPSPTQIDGKLNANGNVVIINQNGVIFGQNAKVDVNGLLATTADASNADLMKDGALHLNKAGNPDAAVINSGQINARDAGLVGLVAPNVLNSGTINAKLGRVALSSGDTAVVDFYGDGLLQVAVSEAVKSQLVANTPSGKITADGGTIQITAAAGRKIVNNLITVEGSLQARSVAQKNGEIIIAAIGSNAVASNVAAHKGLKQGSSAVLVAGVLDASGRSAGERGGKVSVLGDEIALLNGTIIDVSGHSGAVDTTKGKAISSERKGAAGGEVKIGGDYLGQGATPTAKNLYVAKGAYVFADSTHAGDAGRAIFWSDDTTKFYGNVFARSLAGNGVDVQTGDAKPSPFGRGQGEGLSGNGGFVETSGHKNLDVGGYVNLTASQGERGTYFLDPTNITIYGNVDPKFVSTDNSINLAPNLRLWLDGDDIDGDGISEDSAEAGLVSGAGNCGTAITCVATWSDKSGNVNHATQATPSARPQFSSNTQNGRDVLSFDGGDTLTSTGINLGTFFVTGRRQANANAAWFELSGGAHERSFGILSGETPIYVTDEISYLNGLLVRETINNSDYVGGTNNIALRPMTYNTPLIVTGYDTIAVRTNATINFGYATPSNIRLNGTINEFINYSTLLTTLPRNLVEQYQSAKWGIGLDPISGTAIGGGAEVAEATAHNAALPNDAATNGYSVFTTRYLERLSQSANISLQASNNINLDLKGDNLNFTTANRSLTLTAGNQITTASTGSITTNNGAINLNANNGILVNHAIGLNSNGGNINLNNDLRLIADANINAGSGTVTFAGKVDSGSAVSALVVAGGGGGGGGTGGGGGAGGVLYQTALNLVPNALVNVTVGAGGTGGTGANARGNSGSNSTFSSLTAIGGGGGGSNSVNGLSGGSGGGSGHNNSPGGSGTAGQGFGGAAVNSTTAPNYGASGGGGAGSIGLGGTNTQGGNGGDGIANNITGSSVTYGGGGGGGTYFGGTLGAGGSGGGGGATVAGTNGLGGGGGGATNNTGNSGNGGSGVVIVRQSGLATNATVTTGTSSTVGTDTVWTFLSNGSFTPLSSTPSNLTVNGGNIIFSDNVGSIGKMNNISLTSANSIILPNINAASILAQTTSAAADIVSTSNLVTQGGNINIDSGRNIDFSNAGIRTNNGNMTFNAGQDIVLNASTNAGTGAINAIAGRDISVVTNNIAPVSGLINYWNFDEATGTIAIDSVASNNGTLAGGTIRSADTPYGFGTSLSFNGSSNYVDFGTYSPNANTISFWVKNNSSANAPIIYAGDDTYDSNTWDWSHFNFVSNTYYRGNPGGGSGVYNKPNGAWDQVTIIRDNGLGRHNTYINGKLVIDNTDSSTTETLGRYLRIAKANNVYFDGLIDDVRIYETALTSAQVGKLYSYSPAIIASSISFRASNDISLNNTLAASGAGDAIILAAGRNIINNAGAGALSTPAGRWLLYSTNPTDTTGEELLASNFNRYNCTYTACNAGVTIPATSNGLIYSFVPTLSVTGLSSSKSFDGNANAPLTGATLGGILAGDTGITLNTAGVTGAFADELVGTAKPITLTGLYTLGGTNYGYNLLQPTGVTGTITAASSGGGGGGGGGGSTSSGTTGTPEVNTPVIVSAPSQVPIIIEQKPINPIITPINPPSAPVVIPQPNIIAIPNTVQINSQLGLPVDGLTTNSAQSKTFENRPPLDLNEDNSVVTSNDNVSNNSNQSDEAKSNEKQPEQNLADNKINQTQQNLSVMNGLLRIHPKLQQLFSIKKL